MNLIHTMETGYSLQRLFSTFPGSWPGVGLVLIRVGLFATLVSLGPFSQPGPAPESWKFLPQAIAAMGGLFLLAGLWTPLMGVVVAVDEVAIWAGFAGAREEAMWIHLFLAVVSVGIAMLGPGAWSVDARLFGRKRFDGGQARGRRR